MTSAADRAGRRRAHHEKLISSADGTRALVLAWAWLRSELRNADPAMVHQHANRAAEGLQDVARDLNGRWTP